MIVDSHVLDQLVNQLIQQRSLEFNDTEREAFTRELIDKISESILRRLPDDKLPEFEQVLEEGDAERVKTFMQSEIRDLGSVVQEAIA